MCDIEIRNLAKIKNKILDLSIRLHFSNQVWSLKGQQLGPASTVFPYLQSLCP